MEFISESEGVATLLIFLLLALREIRALVSGGYGDRPKFERVAAETLEAVKTRLGEIRILLPPRVIAMNLRQLDEMHRMVTELHDRLVRGRK